MRKSSGFSLIELIVSVVIALLASLAILQIFQISEQRKRVTTGGNDAMQNGSYAAVYLSSLLKGAGSGMVTLPHACSCQIVMNSNTNSLFPAGGPVTSPAYTNVGTASGDVTTQSWSASALTSFQATFGPILTLPAGQNLFYSPAYVVAGSSANNPDSLIVLSGNSTGLAVPISYTAINNSTAGNSTVTLANNVGVHSGDLIAGVNNVSSGTATCAISQVSVPTVTASGNDQGESQLNAAATLTGTYALTDFSAISGAQPTFTDLGQPGNTYFKVFAISKDPTLGTVNSLLSFDLITGAVQTISDNIINMKMLYLINSSGTLSYQAPSGNYLFSTLSNGSTSSHANIQNLMGIRFALVMQNGQRDPNTVTSSNLTLFSDLASTLQVSMTLSSAQQHYRYKVIDITVPFRNLQASNGNC